MGPPAPRRSALRIFSRHTSPMVDSVEFVSTMGDNAGQKGALEMIQNDAVWVSIRSALPERIPVYGTDCELLQVPGGFRVMRDDVEAIDHTYTSLALAICAAHFHLEPVE